jgi:hypothetical protein
MSFRLFLELSQTQTRRRTASSGHDIDPELEEEEKEATEHDRLQLQEDEEHAKFYRDPNHGDFFLLQVFMVTDLAYNYIKSQDE